MEQEWEEVFRTDSDIEAEFIKGLLATAAIPVYVEAHGAKTMPYIFGTSGFGQLVLKVPPDLAELAQAILQAKAQSPEEAD